MHAALLAALALSAHTGAQRFGMGDVREIFGGGLDQNGVIRNADPVSQLKASVTSRMVDARFEELMGAIVDGDMESAKVILAERPHSVNHRSVVTPLHAAVQHRHPAMVAWLISQGADVNARTEDGSTAIALAAYNGDMELVRVLAERGADPAVRNQQGYNALEVAAMQGFPEVKEWLMTPGRFQNAAMQGDLPTVQRMLKKRPWRVDETRRFSALHAAARFGHVDLVRFLLNEGANPDVQMFDASSPLILAAAEGHDDIVNALLSNGADPSHVNTLGFDAVKAAHSQKHTKLGDHIATFLEKDATAATGGVESPVDGTTSTTGRRQPRTEL